MRLSIPRYLVLSVILLVIAYTRIIRLDDLQLTNDEVWSVWSTQGNFQQMLGWIAYDWPPLYPTMVWMWQNLVGIHPILMRFSSVLLALLAYSMAYRASFAIFRNHNAALLACITYAALGYSHFLSTFFRAYVLMMFLLPLAIWMAIRYFKRPSVKNAVFLALTMASLFYTNLTAVIAFATIGILTLGLYGRNIWRWWLPSLLALTIAIPEILSKLSLLQRRIANNPIDLPLPAALATLFNTFWGTNYSLWWILIVIVALTYLRFEPLPKRLFLTFSGWVIVLPIIVYFLDERLGFFDPRYSWWVLLGVAFCFGGIALFLDKRLIWLISIMLMAIMFLPVADANYERYAIPFEDNFTELSRWIQAGDVILIDPNCYCGQAVEWDYFQQVYFPRGLDFVQTVTNDNRRIWYVSHDGSQDPTMFQEINAGRIATKFFGPPNFLFRLYEAPPEPEGIMYENGMRFHGYEVLSTSTPALYPLLGRENTTLHLRLWWSVDHPISQDYSVSVQMLSNGTLVSQSDSSPNVIQLDPTQSIIPPSATSQWQVGQFYVDERHLVIPPNTTTGQKELLMILYQWWDGVRINSEQTDSDGIFPLSILNIMAW